MEILQKFGNTHMLWVEMQQMAMITFPESGGMEGSPANGFRENVNALKN